MQYIYHYTIRFTLCQPILRLPGRSADRTKESAGLEKKVGRAGACNSPIMRFPDLKSRRERGRAVAKNEKRLVRARRGSGIAPDMKYIKIV